MIAGLISFAAGPIGRWVLVALGAVLVALAAAALLAGIRMQAYNAGYDKCEAQTSAAIANANQQARIAERAASARLAKLATEHHKEQADAQTEIDRLRADLRRGAKRLSVRVAAVPGCQDTAAAAPPGPETRAELDGATADALVAVAADGDAAIRQSNALIDAYAIAADVCGK